MTASIRLSHFVPLALMVLLSACGGGGGDATDDGGGAGNGTTPLPPGGGTVSPVLPPSSEYEGFGAVTQGAASCPTAPATYHVTSLADAGPGTFRDALSQDCRYIVFDVGGTITITSDIIIRSSYLTIDGLTAPFPGITINHPTINEGVVVMPSAASGPAHDIIVHHLRHVGPGGHDDTSSDMWGLDGQDDEVYNIVFDHMTMSGSNDGIFDIWGRVHDVTVSWNLITDTMTAMHLSSPDGTDLQNNISFHHNVLARNGERQIKAKFNSFLDYVNNVVYGWGWTGCAGRGLQLDSDGSIDPTVNAENNYFLNVTAASCADSDGAIVFQNGVGSTKIYLAGNIVPAGETGVSTAARMAIPLYAEVTKYAASTLGTNVVPNAGTNYRAAAEQALLDQIMTAISP